MNKAELIAKLADDAGITKTQANTSLDAFVDAVTKTLKKGDKVIAYSRVLAPGVSFDGFPGIGRVCVSQTARRLGLGQVLVEKTLSVAAELWPDTDIHISAQCYLQQFYQDLGFKPASEPYLEDDIPHLKMIKPVLQ